jgi:hypothetical protein
LLERERRGLLERKLEELPALYREALSLRFEEEMTFEEIAEVLSWTLSLFALLAVRLLSGESLFWSATRSTLSWSFAYFVSAWISGAAVLVLLGFHVRRERRRA